MLQVNPRSMMADTSQSVHCMSNSSVFSMLRRNELTSWAERQSNYNDFQTEGALMLKTFADNASAMRGTERRSLSDDLKASDRH